MRSSMKPPITNAERELLRQVADWPELRLETLDNETLSQVGRERGIDFATALLYRAICRSPDQGPFLQRIEELIDAPTAPSSSIDAAFVIAPGAFYREHPQTGADGKRPCQVAASLGCRTHVLPTESVASAAVNGRIICDWLFDTQEHDIILCSLSKGGADVKMALAEPRGPHAFRNVVAWINVGGITSGSPMATWLLDRPWLARLYRALFWLRGQDFQFVRELQRGRDSRLDFTVTMPPRLKVIHVLGFPLAQHVRRRPTRRWHRRLSCYGPNDGATILADSLELPGLILPVWGEDHYLDSCAQPEILLSALLKYVAEDLHLDRSATRIPTLARSSVAP